MKFEIATIVSLILLATSNVEVVAYSYGLSKSEKENLLNLHRNTRKALNSPNMKEIYWDEELAKSAQKYSEKCIFDHDKNFPKGENLAWGGRDRIYDYYQSWVKEKADFDASNNREKLKSIYYKNRAIGHYSQIVQAVNTKVGCGYNYCKKEKKQYLVCRYEEGNMKNREVYALPSDNRKTTKTTKKTTTKTKTVTKSKTTKSKTTKSKTTKSKTTKSKTTKSKTTKSKTTKSKTTKSKTTKSKTTKFTTRTTTTTTINIQIKTITPTKPTYAGQEISKKYRCSSGDNNKRCPNGFCCSQYGYCGKDDSFCGNGCQSEFGRCN